MADGATSARLMHGAAAAGDALINDASAIRHKALADLEANMVQLEQIVVQKDQVIEGLRLSLNDAL